MMYPSLQILSEWFGRTIIHSCTKLSYDHAQSMIESPTRTVPKTELPPIAPEHTSDEVHQAVLNLHRIAQELRKQRFLDGALRLDQVSSFLVSVQPTNLTCAYTTCTWDSAWLSRALPAFSFPSHCPTAVFSGAGTHPPIPRAPGLTM